MADSTEKMSLQTTSCSKINLFLAVTGRRPDGYHEIETVFLPLAEPCDTVSMAESDTGLRVSSDEPALPNDSRNLCHKAATAYAAAAGISPAWSIHVKKNIPVAGGMAGGSSNAAAVLRLLQKTHKALSDQELKRLALSLGADVPFFLDPRPSVGRGVGECLNPVKVGGNIPLVVLAPLFPTSARWAYEHCAKVDDSKANLSVVLAALAAGDLVALAAAVRNDLGPVLYRKFPALRIFQKDLLDAGALAAEISGSGSSLFALCESDEKAADVIERMNEHYGDAVHCLRGKPLMEVDSGEK